MKCTGAKQCLAQVELECPCRGLAVNRLQFISDSKRNNPSVTDDHAKCVSM